MTKGKRIADEVIQAIADHWAKGPNKSAGTVRAEYKRGQGGREVPSLRKFQQIIAEAKEGAADRVYSLVEWVPWQDESESPDDAAHLLKLDAISMAATGRHLYQHEARWGRRLRTALDGLTPWQQYTITSLYAGREVAAHYLGHPRAATGDLDGILAYRPWLPENEDAYNGAIIGGAVHHPAWLSPHDTQEHVEALKQVQSEEIDSWEYGRRTSYWKIAKRMFDQLPRRAQHIDRTNEKSFVAWTLDGVLDFWAGEEPHASQATESEGDQDERLDQTSEQE